MSHGFNRRTGPKRYLAVVPILFVFFLLVPPMVVIVPAMLLAAAFVTRLNDIGWPRWHALWLMAWAALAKMIAMAPLGGGISFGARHQAFAVTAWPFLAVALLLAAPRGRPHRKDRARRLQVGMTSGQRGE